METSERRYAATVQSYSGLRPLRKHFERIVSDCTRTFETYCSNDIRSSRTLSRCKTGATEGGTKRKFPQQALERHQGQMRPSEVVLSTGRPKRWLALERLHSCCAALQATLCCSTLRSNRLRARWGWIADPLQRRDLYGIGQGCHRPLHDTTNERQTCSHPETHAAI